MTVHNSEIAALFDELADLLEIEGANPFRVRAYRNAARTVSGLSASVADLLKEDRDLTRLPGIGDDLADKMKTIVETGRFPLLDEVRQRVPPALSELMRIEGLGPKRVKTLYEKLKINSVADLKRAVANGKIRQLEGFGEKTEAMIKARIAHLAGEETRVPLITAAEIAAPLCAYLKKIKGVKQLTVAGSFRRCRETVGDLDILVTASKTAPVIDRFADYDEVTEVISHGTTRSTVRLRSGLQVDLRVVPEVSYGAALHYFTGSKAHNIAVRTLGVKKNLKINEYGVFKGDKRIASRTEAEVFKCVGLPYIEPELRENRGEIEAAGKGKLPALVTPQDIRGDLHCHTQATDGHHSLEEMAAAARARGYAYLAITDHSRRLTVARGLDEARLRRQLEQIDRLNETLSGIRILKSIELDILEDGTLDLPDTVLAELDLTVCSVHSKFDLPSAKQTERLIRAMDNPHFNILAHPTGRLINQRPPYDMDLERLMGAAKERGCFLEVNSQPVRMDLNDSACKMAKEIGLKVAVCTDAHSVDQLDYLRYGINQARRGWLEKDDVINTQSLTKLIKLLRRG
jgi:DNA polymerase (family 10)